MVDIALAVGTPALAGLVWLIRLEGRVDFIERMSTEVLKRLDRIEGKQDDLQNFLRTPR